MPCNASYTRFIFLKIFSYVLQIDMHFICTPMWTKFYSCEKWVLQSPRVTSKQRLLVKCSCLKIEWVNQDLAQISPKRLGFDCGLRESVGAHEA
jgi:hypothetical protein